VVSLFVGGLSYDVSSDELRNAVHQFVPDADAEVIVDRMSGRSKGFGFIKVADTAAAQMLVDAFDGKDLLGRRIQVSEARPWPESPFRPRSERPHRPLSTRILEPLADLPTPTPLILIGKQVSDSLFDYFVEHPEEMTRMPCRRFEELIAEVLERLGYVVELTKRTRDGGIDIIAIRDAEISTRYLIECKRLEPHNKISVEPVRQLFGVKQDLGASKAILATTVYFTPDARKFIDRHPWELEGKDYDGVVDWLKLAAKRRAAERER